MPSGLHAKKQWEKNALTKLGQNAIMYRPSSGTVSNFYGDITSGTMTSGLIRIIHENHSFFEDETPLGGLASEKKAIIKFSCKGDLDIRIGDYVDWPYGSAQRWQVFQIMPEQYDNVIIWQWVIAHREQRY